MTRRTDYSGSIQRTSTLRCPACGKETEEQMPDRGPRDAAADPLGGWLAGLIDEVLVLAIDVRMCDVPLVATLRRDVSRLVPLSVGGTKNHEQ